MPGWVWAIIAVAIVVIGLIALLTAWRRQRTSKLQGRFGPEYDRTVERHGSRRDAERDLQERAERRQELELRPLSPAARERYSTQWNAAQQRFVDDPAGAIAEADRLVAGVMQERGYPVGDDFERRAADLSVDHPHLVENYRGASRITQISRERDASTEEQRQAMVHFRGLFDELLTEGAVGQGNGAATAGHGEGAVEQGYAPARQPTADAAPRE